jgi:hypothetical protein
MSDTPLTPVQLDAFARACREEILRMMREQGITPAQAARILKQSLDALAAAAHR